MPRQRPAPGIPASGAPASPPRCPNGPEPSLARRFGVLSNIDPAVLERIAELRHIAQHALDGPLRRIATVAREFDAWISPDEFGRCKSPHIVLSAMLAKAEDSTRPIVEALEML